MTASLPLRLAADNFDCQTYCQTAADLPGFSESSQTTAGSDQRLGFERPGHLGFTGTLALYHQCERHHCQESWSGVTVSRDYPMMMMMMIVMMN